MNNNTLKNSLNTILLTSIISIGLLTFTGYRQLNASGRITGKMQASSSKAKAIITPKADVIDDIINELLKFIKKY